MTHEELEAEVAHLKTQLMMAVQVLISLKTTVIRMTGGKEVLQKVKPGFENTVNDIPVPSDSPLYRLVSVNMTKSKILGNDGAAFRKNGS